MLIAESRPGDVEDIADHERRVTRAEEQLVRSARTVYALSQQVTQFQDDLGKLNLRSVDESKKVFDVSILINFSLFLRLVCAMFGSLVEINR